MSATAPGLAMLRRVVVLPATGTLDLQFEAIESRRDSLVITAKSLEPSIDLRNSEVFNRTLFTRDDQVFQQLDAGINAGQHEGGGKSLEIRRFGFNLDHGGVNGGLKVLVDDVQQNQGSQGHGQGYLGSLKALSPELIEGVTIINGPFSPEYGDFSGLGVVHIRQKEALPDEFTARLEGGNYNTGRRFLAFSPANSYVAYEGSYTDGPFQNPGAYRRDNVNANFTKSLSSEEKLGFRFIFGRNNFSSSGQIPLDLVNEGKLDRFGYVDPTDGGRVKLGTASAYYSKAFANGDTLKADGFVGRSLFDLFSNFTYFLNDPVNGDAFQQHDSRLQEGANGQYMHSHKIGHVAAVFTSGRAYGFEAKTSVELTHHLSLNAGLTKILIAYFRGGDHRVYVDSAPHFVASAGLTLAAWWGWSGSLRMRAINHYRLDGEDASIVASGHTVWDLGISRRITSRVDFNVSLDNLLSRDYYETQNYFDSRVTPDAPSVSRIHATPAYPLTAIAGVTMRFGRK